MVTCWQWGEDLLLEHAEAVIGIAIVFGINNVIVVLNIEMQSPPTRWYSSTLRLPPFYRCPTSMMSNERVGCIVNLGQEVLGQRHANGRVL